MEVLLRFVRLVALLAIGSALTLGCVRREPPPPSPSSAAPTASPGAPMFWDVGSEILKHPLPEDMADGYLEMGKAPGFSYGVMLVRERLSARSHERSDALMYVHSGSARFSVGEKSWTVGLGDVIYIPRGAIYNASPRDDLPLQLFTVYSPRLDPNDIVYSERADSDREGISVQAVSDSL